MSSQIRLFNEDCMVAMARMKDKQYDLAICDPPYGINAPNMQMGNAPNRKGKGEYPSISAVVVLRKGRLNSGAGKLKDRVLQMMPVKWDYEKPSPKYFTELRRVAVNQIIFGGNYFNLGPTRCVICWDKVQPWDNFSQWEMAWTSFDRPAALLSLANFLQGKIHPTQKPVALYKWLLTNYAKPGDRILDTHGGSGSICIACHDLGFSIDWYEIDAEYFQAAKERLERHQRQERLPLDAPTFPESAPLFGGPHA